MLRPAFGDFDISYATTNAALAGRDGIGHVELIGDCNRHQPLRTLRSLAAAFRILRKVRPDIVVTTGALPGFLCLLVGYFAGAKTIWIDSVANADELSMSGSLATWFASITLTQWPHLAHQDRVKYIGSLL